MGKRQPVIYMDDGAVGFTVTENAMVEGYRTFINKDKRNVVNNNYAKGFKTWNYKDALGTYLYPEQDEAAMESIREAAGIRTPAE